MKKKLFRKIADKSTKIQQAEQGVKGKDKPNWKLWLMDKKECKIWLDIYVKKKILEKKKDESILYFNKAEHNLNLANWLDDKHEDEIPEAFGEETFYDWVLNMYYYAVYHAGLALVSKLLFKSKSHMATLCFLIYYYYHKEEIIDKEDVELVAVSLEKEDIETITTTKSLRERASYNVHALFEKEIAEDAKDKAVVFLQKVRGVI